MRVFCVIRSVPVTTKAGTTILTNDLFAIFKTRVMAQDYIDKLVSEHYSNKSKLHISAMDVKC